MSMPIIKYVLGAAARMPERANPTDAGLDLFSIQDWDLIPGSTELIDTGFSVEIPEGYVGLLFSRSSQGKSGITLANCVGVIDSSYRGNIKLLLKNNSFNYYYIKANETKIGQLVVMPIILPTLIPFNGSKEEWLASTNRGAGGFGSTGGV